MHAQRCCTSDVPVGAGQWKLEQQRQTLRNSDWGAGGGGGVVVVVGQQSSRQQFCMQHKRGDQGGGKLLTPQPWLRLILIREGCLRYGRVQPCETAKACVIHTSWLHALIQLEKAGMWEQRSSSTYCLHQHRVSGEGDKNN